MTLPHTSAAALYAARYAPTSDELRGTLPDVGDGLRTQLAALCEAPTLAACDQLSTNLAGAQTAVRKLREALLREQATNGR